MFTARSGVDERVAHFARGEDFEVARAAAAHLDGLLRERGSETSIASMPMAQNASGTVTIQRDRAFARTADGAPPQRALAPRVALAGADVEEVARRRPAVVGVAAFRLHLSPPKGKTRTSFAVIWYQVVYSR